MTDAGNRASGGKPVRHGFFRDIPIRSKLLFGYCTAFVLAISLGGLIIYSLVQKSLEISIEAELSNSNNIISSMVKTSADISIKNYLRAVAEDNKSIVNSIYEQYLHGELTEEAAKKRAREILLSQPIGRTGYLYCVDSKGVAVVHRNPGVQGRNWSNFSFVQEQMKRKEGYLVYEWKNPGEAAPRPKSLYMTHFMPWDWIVSASSYREEFFDLVNVDDIRRSILGMRFGKTGYSYIIDGKGNVVVHPAYSGNLLYLDDPNDREAVRRILQLKTGKLMYDWQNPHEKVRRKKLVIINHIPEFDWIVGSSVYMDELYAPLYRIGNTIIAIIVGTLVLILLYTLWISSVITSPLRTLMDHFSSGSKGDFSVRMGMASRDEIGSLAHYFNIFMEKLQEYSNSLHEEIQGHMKSEEALRTSEERYRSLSDNTPDIIYETDRDLNIVYLNKAGFSLIGISPEDLTRGISIRDLISETDFDWTEKAFRVGKNFLSTHKIKRKDGSFLIGENNGSIIFEGTMPVGLRGSIRDVTDKRRMEEQILQSQKMETIGTLAGGLAHDFNNVLSGITSTLSIIRYELGKDKVLNMERFMRHLDLMERSGRRATDMVQQLLTLSRKRETEFSPVDLNSTIENVMKICSGTFDKSIEISVEKPSERALVQADPTQIEQVLLNLCVNASHAMTMMRPEGSPMGGRLMVSLERFHADEHFCATHHEAGEIEYWKLSVRDTGVGMDNPTISKIFMPFFTTKEKGSGTGLGLSMVYNLVHQHKGFIDLYSEPGVGTTLNVYLPALHLEGAQEGMETKGEIPHGEGLILVVDDEEVLRETARSILEQCGYTVITAHDGEDGIRIFKEHHPEIRGVLLDLVMPKKSGDKAYLEMKKIDPKLKVILASGFKQDERVETALDSGINAFIQKPYTLEQLARTMAELLGGDALE